MDSDSPPRKKLKQARLPFQILSPKDTVADPIPPSSRKRHLSEDSGDDVAVVKVVKKSEECKENAAVISPSTDIVEIDSASIVTNEKEEIDSKCDDSNLKTGMEKGNILQTQMKSTLANLFGKKKFDVTADVGSCDCGCEEVGSGDDAMENEAMEEYLEHCKKRHVNEKNVKGNSKRKSGAKTNGKLSSPAKKSPSSEKESKTKSPASGRKRRTKSPGEASPSSDKQSQSKSLSVESPVSEKKQSKKRKSTGKQMEREAEVESKPAQGAETVILETKKSQGTSNKERPVKTPTFSQKSQELFARWRKGPSNNSDGVSSAASSHIPTEISKVNDTQSEEKITNSSNIDAEGSHCADSDKEGPKLLTPVPEASDRKEGSKAQPYVVIEDCKQLEDIKTSLESKAAEGRTSDSSDEAQEADSSHAVEISSSSEGEELVKSDKSESKTLNVIQQLNSSDVIFDIQDKSSLPATPTSVSKIAKRQLTPKQLERQRESARKQEEKERQKIERENEKKRLKQEKDEQKKKEKEEKEEQRRKEKEEKEKKKQAEQEQKNEEKKKKELLKAEEKRKKEEEKKKVEEEKKRADEEEERKKAKASALFTSFFVPKGVKGDREEAPAPPPTVQNFMPFEVKADMRMAPTVRLTLNSSQKCCLDEVLGKDSVKPITDLYLQALKSGKISPVSNTRTWPLDELKEEDDVLIMENDDSGVLIQNDKKVEKMRAKFLQFHENHRPAYRGTWRKKSTSVTGRRPFGQEKILDYEVDSADEWEEEEPGESLHGSDDEKEQESEDEYEVDNSVFVPHGYLSDDEGDGEENEEVLSPETQKAKLKLLGEEFEAQMKSKTSALKPIIIVLTAALQASSFSVRYQKLFERRAVWQEDEGPIVLSKLKSESDNTEGQPALSSDQNCVTFSSGRGAKKKIISEEALPALITLLHGNQNKRIFITDEFSAFLGKSRTAHEPNDQNETDGPSEGCDRPSTPSLPSVNPLVLKWPNLPPASRISISNKIKEVATWGPCPEEGPMYNKQCWYVSEEVRQKYGVMDIKLPNTLWHYTLQPKTLFHSQSPSMAASSNSASTTDPRALITKFTKVMTPEEKQRQWESMKTTGSSSQSTPSSSKVVSAKGSTGKITAFTQQAKTPSSVHSKQNTSSNTQPETPTSANEQRPKKRVQLLVSVPRGQQITSSASHCSLLSKFEASASPKPSCTESKTSVSSTIQKTDDSDSANYLTNQPPSSPAKSSASPSTECIVLD